MQDTRYVFAVVDVQEQWIWLGVSKDPEQAFKRLFGHDERYRLEAAAPFWDVKDANLVYRHLHDKWQKRHVADHWFRYEAPIQNEIKRNFSPIIDFNGWKIVKRRKNKPYIDFIIENRPK